MKENQEPMVMATQLPPSGGKKKKKKKKCLSLSNGRAVIGIQMCQIMKKYPYLFI